VSPNLYLVLFNIYNEKYCDAFHPSSSHNVIQACLGDGSVRPLTPGMSQLTFTIAMVPNDGLPLGSDW
jgi:hypothetical protein